MRRVQLLSLNRILMLQVIPESASHTFVYRVDCDIKLFAAFRSCCSYIVLVVAFHAVYDGYVILRVRMVINQTCMKQISPALVRAVLASELP